MIFRDDDISHMTDLSVFSRVHEMFERACVVHTVALIMQDLDKNMELVKYLCSHTCLNMQLHCWQHVDLTTEPQLDEHMDKAVAQYYKLFGGPLRVLYPPWNKSDDRVVAAARKHHLEVRPDKISLQQYIRVRGDVKEKVVNFHYWAPAEQIMIEPALAIFNSKRNNP